MLLLTALAPATLSFAATTNAPVPVFHTGLGSASAAAALDQSLVLLIFSAEWCGPCKELKKQTLDSPEFKAQGGAVHIADVDVDADPKTARAFGVDAMPTLIAMTSDGKIVGRHTGFMHTAELILWLKEARERLKEGKWEGTAPGSKLGEFTAKAAADRLEPNDLVRLVAMFAEPDPAERAGAAGILAGQREQAMPPLIEALTNSYLGVRIGASELLHQLAPSAATVDPWLSPVELSGTAAALRKWWAQTGSLPPPVATQNATSVPPISVTESLDALRSDNPVARTEAMSSLVNSGPAALPAVRETIKKCERAGDQQSIALLEDVR